MTIYIVLELLCMLVKYEEVQQSILTGLVGILKLQDDTTNSMTKLPTSDTNTIKGKSDFMYAWIQRSITFCHFSSPFHLYPASCCS